MDNIEALDICLEPTTHGKLKIDAAWQFLIDTRLIFELHEGIHRATGYQSNDPSQSMRKQADKVDLLYRIATSRIDRGLSNYVEQDDKLFLYSRTYSGETTPTSYTS